MFLVIINLLPARLWLPFFIDATPALFILTPVFIAMVKQYGIDPSTSASSWFSIS